MIEISGRSVAYITFQYVQFHWTSTRVNRYPKERKLRRTCGT
ncbi:hypothetical protein OH687_19305 [Burkholderia anthina]|nr:hypothetical protein OH687_19305 [Burkholderia anthina]